MEPLYRYTNGNTNVELYNDGTKVRYYTDTPVVEYPESMDIKITNYCDPVSDSPICAYCHEKSNLQGQHADLDKLINILSVLPKGIECALGGGNTLTHPKLIWFLEQLKFKSLVANMTVNQKHIAKYKDQLSYIVDNKLIYGLGISYQSKDKLKDVVPYLKTNNVVFHMIMGINTLQDIEDCYQFCQANNVDCKILILGYKNYGNGINFLLKNKQIEDNKYQWYIKLAQYFKRKNIVLSFDNLAIEQLKLKRYFTDEAWDKFYMGNEGSYTLYIDAVRQEFARSSTSLNRKSFDQISLLDYFKSLHEKH